MMNASCYSELLSLEPCSLWAQQNGRPSPISCSRIKPARPTLPASLLDLFSLNPRLEWLVPLAPSRPRLLLLQPSHSTCRARHRRVSSSSRMHHRAPAVGSMLSLFWIPSGSGASRAPSFTSSQRLSSRSSANTSLSPSADSLSLPLSFKEKLLRHPEAPCHCSSLRPAPPVLASLR